jgi:hypothetical protein
MLADPNFDNDEKLLRKRVVCYNFDNNGNAHWNVENINVQGKIPGLGPSHVSAKDRRSATVTQNVGFFQEYEGEFRDWTKHRSDLWGRKERIYNWMDRFWHMEWAPSWNSASQMTNDNGQREQWIRQTARISDDNHSIPFFTDEQMGPDPKDRGTHLIDRMDGAQFRFMREVSECNKRARENNSLGSWELLQERAYHFKRTREFMSQVCDEIDIRYGELEYTLQTSKFLIRAGGDPKRKLEKLIAPSLLKGPTTSLDLGELTLPIISEGLLGDLQVSFNPKKELVKQKVLSGLEAAQLPRSVLDIERRRQYRKKLSKDMGPSAGSVILREHYLPDDSDDESSARAASNATSTEGSQLIVLSSGEEDLDQEPTTQEDDSLDARSEASATGSEPEVLIAEEIPDFNLEDVLPATRTAIFMHLPGIRQAEYDWLRKHGVSEEVAGFCLEGTSQGPGIMNENRKTAITNHNFLHRALAQDALKTQVAWERQGTGEFRETCADRQDCSEGERSCRSDHGSEKSRRKEETPAPGSNCQRKVYSRGQTRTVYTRNAFSSSPSRNSFSFSRPKENSDSRNRVA